MHAAAVSCTYLTCRGRRHQQLQLHFKLHLQLHPIPRLPFFDFSRGEPGNEATCKHVKYNLASLPETYSCDLIGLQLVCAVTYMIMYRGGVVLLSVASVFLMASLSFLGRMPQLSCLQVETVSWTEGLLPYIVMLS